MSSSSKVAHQATPPHINSASFQTLYHVHYLILDILKEEIPATLILTCRKMYEDLISKVYDRVTISGQTCISVIAGANIQCNPELESEHQEEEKANAKGRPTTENHPHCSTSGRKNVALGYTKSLALTDSQGAAQFMKYCYNCCWPEACDPQHNLQAPLLPSVTHLHLGKELTLHLAEMHVGDREYLQDLKRSHIYHHFLESLWKHTSPATVGLEWPENWETNYWNRHLIASGEDEPGLGLEPQWSMTNGMEHLINKIAQHDPVKHIILHINAERFDVIKYNVSMRHAQASLTFHFNKVDGLSQSYDTNDSNQAILDSLWSHFDFVMIFSYPNIPSQYSLPFVEGLNESITIYQPKYDRLLIVRLSEFKNRIHTPADTCPCYEDSIEN